MIALDAMGGDSAPRTPVAGAIIAARQSVPIILYGDEDLLISYLDDCDALWRTLPITVQHCSGFIKMAEMPSRSVIRKTDSSLVRAMHDLADDKVSAVVSAGNSGATVVAATLIVGRIPGVLRPALGGFLPTPYGKIFCLDLGANSDVRPEMMCQFAHMGSLYVKHMGVTRNPRVALISNGAEGGKGSQLVKQVHALLRQDPSLQFVGNLEPRDLFKDYADVVVTDGFTGNIMLKTVQGTAQAMSDWLRLFAKESVLHTVSLFGGGPILRHLRSTTDYARAGGGLLLGVKRPCFVGHGCSSDEAIAHALIKAHEFVHTNILACLNDAIVHRMRRSKNACDFQREMSR